MLVSIISLNLTKEVCNRTAGTCDAATGGGFSASNSGAPGDVLVYRLVFENPGSEPIDSVTVNDLVPAYSALTADAPAIISQPSGLTCALTVPTGPGAGYAGPLAWECAGAMVPGGRGIATFHVQVDN